MSATIGSAILFAIVGTVVGALWTFVIGLAGAPGAFIARLRGDEWHGGRQSWFGLLLCLLGQSYASLAFVAMTIGYLTNLLSDRPELIDGVLWIVCFFVALLPSTAALKDAASKPTKRAQDVATTFTVPLTLIGFFVFAFYQPAMRTGWGWLPFV